MPIVTMRELLEAGVHYGHHASRWNPKMGPYIYKKRQSIHVVDLRQTVRGLVRGRRFLSVVAERGGEILLVVTKSQAKATVQEQGRRAGIHYVSERWLGGTLTNFEVVMGRMKRLEQLEEMEQTGEIENKGKKFAAVLRREMAKLQTNLGGVREMKRSPDAMIIVDPRREKNALREAWALDIPTVCLQDTDSDPERVDIVIPGNDDAMRSIQLICSKLMDAVLEGRAKRPVPPEAQEQVGAPQATPSPAANDRPPETGQQNETPKAQPQPAAGPTEQVEKNDPQDQPGA